MLFQKFISSFYPAVIPAAESKVALCSLLVQGAGSCNTSVNSSHVKEYLENVDEQKKKMPLLASKFFDAISLPLPRKNQHSPPL